MRRAAGAALVAVAAALAAGCGGASEEEYARAVDAFCRDVRGSLQRFEERASAVDAGADEQTAARAFGGALADLSDGLRRATDRLRDAEPPEGYEDFGAQTAQGFAEAARRLDAVAAAAREGDAGALRDLDRRLGLLGVPDGPPELRDRAPACRS